MILRIVVADGSQSPALAESAEVADDGAICGWRSVSGDGVGWFGGTLSDAEVRGLRSLVDATGGKAPAPIPPAPGSASETLELEPTGPVAIAGIRDGAQPWAVLAAAARLLIDRLTDFPRSAVALVPAGEGRAQLVHRGTEPLHLDLSTVELRVTAWRGYYQPAGDWSLVVAGPAEVEAGPGWSYGFDLGPDIPAGRDITLHVTAEFAILSGTTRVPVAAAHAPEIPNGTSENS
jgi:hypothetical protein